MLRKELGLSLEEKENGCYKRKRGCFYCVVQIAIKLYRYFSAKKVVKKKLKKKHSVF